MSGAGWSRTDEAHVIEKARSSLKGREKTSRGLERPPKANQMHVKDFTKLLCKDSQFTEEQKVKVLTAVVECSWQGTWCYFDHSESHPQDHISD
jgi:hypothetical protein